jgi:hypothetical protein
MPELENADGFRATFGTLRFLFGGEDESLHNVFLPGGRMRAFLVENLSICMPEAQIRWGGGTTALAPTLAVCNATPDETTQ